MDIVLIPCYNRPEFLEICLERITKAYDAHENVYVFALEFGYHKDIDGIIEAFPYAKKIYKRDRRLSKGNQYNVMQGYRESFEWAKVMKSNLIYNIEPDIWISKGFFQFHNKAHQNPCFSVSACHNQDNKNAPEWSDDIYKFKSFQSLGVSFKLSVVEEIQKHAVLEYYQNPVHYLDGKFPQSTRKGKHYEQAGLINRIREFSEVDHSIFPCRPLAYHAGFYGINRAAKKIEGTTKEKAAILRKMTADEMNSRAVKYKDIKPCDLDAECPKDMKMT